MIFHQPNNSLTNYNYNVATYTDTVWEHHFHRNPELIYVIRGSLKCTVSGRDYLLSQNDFGLTLPCEVHRYEPVGDTVYWVLVFSCDFVSQFAKETNGKSADGFSFFADDAVREFLEKRLINNPNPSIFTLKACLYAITEEYLKKIRLRKNNEKKLKDITQITEYVHDNYKSRLTLRDVANKFGYDYHYMSRYFRKSFNMSFNDYVNICRLEMAVKLLDDESKSITCIADECGFQSLRNFNEFFKRNIKMSPTQYRKGKVRMKFE